MKTRSVVTASSIRRRSAAWTILVDWTKVGDRVCWDKFASDLGTVVGVTWSGVAIKWDDGHTVSVRHNNVTKVERALANLN